MQMTSADEACRYIPGIGTRTDHSSRFGDLLKRHGVELPLQLPLSALVDRGWIKPMLRVALPRTAFDSWQDYPLSSMTGTEACPEADQWALDLYARSVSGPFPHERGDWWTYFLDDPSDPLAQQARGHALIPAADPLPEVFHHVRYNQEVRPWIDYFAYWQVFQVAELVDAATGTLVLTQTDGDYRTIMPQWVEFTNTKALRIAAKWEKRRATLEWLSRMRTVLGASVMPPRTWSEVAIALKAVAGSIPISPEEMQREVRDVLLVMWEELAGTFSRLTRKQEPLLSLLRQEIEYSLVYLECLTGKHADFFDPVWYDDRQSHEWARLIDALPREEELARKDFPRQAMTYLTGAGTKIPQVAGLDAAKLRVLVNAHWDRSRSLRRFVLAFQRLHQELHGQKLMESENVVRMSERIEQFNLTMLQAERVLSAEYRERTKSAKYPEIRALAKDTLNHVLCRWGLMGKGIGAAAQAKAHDLLQARAMLHELDPNDELPLVQHTDVATGTAEADEVVAALVNFVIARNYAAHHDALDGDLIYPGSTAGKPHAGGLALVSVLISVIVALTTR